MECLFYYEQTDDCEACVNNSAKCRMRRCFTISDIKTELGVTCEYGGNDTFDRDVWHG